LSFPQKIVRQARYKHPATYMDEALAGTPNQEEREVGPHDLPFEFMLNTLRLVEGFPVHAFVERTGLAMSTIEPALVEAERRGLIHRDFERIAPTELGQRFLNDLQELFLKDTRS
jgi:oxygen-independent coproporphyrinogen-3 oxidase